MRDNSRLLLEALLERIDGGQGRIVRKRIFKLNNRVRHGEVALIDHSARVEHHEWLPRGNRRIRVRRNVAHVLHLRGVGAVCSLVEKDARDGDVGGAVGSPARILVDLAESLGDGARGPARGDVAEQLDVWELVQAGEGRDVSGFRVLRGAGPAVRVDDELELDGGMGGYLVPDGLPGAVLGVAVQW